jgi:hypothetical protein
MKTVIVVVDSDGESHIDLQGFHGQGCGKVLRDFAGEDTAKIERSKREYFEAVRETEKSRS